MIWDFTHCSSTRTITGQTIWSVRIDTFGHVFSASSTKCVIAHNSIHISSLNLFLWKEKCKFESTNTRWKVDSGESMNDMLALGQKVMHIYMLQSRHVRTDDGRGSGERFLWKKKSIIITIVIYRSFFSMYIVHVLTTEWHSLTETSTYTIQIHP